MTFLEKITPSFLKKFDRTLLLNHPDFWSTRFVYILLFTILGFIGISSLFFFANYDVRAYSNEFNWMFLLSFFIFVCIVIWFLFLFRFNVFKRFGNIKKSHFLIQFLCFFFTFFLFFTWFTSINFVESYQANKKYSTQELANDINAFNKHLAINQQHEMPTTWGLNAYKLVNNATKQQLESGVVSESYYTTNEGGNEQSVVKETFFKSFIPKMDSVIKINDSIYYEYTCPNYCMVNNASVFETCSIKYLSNKEIYFTVLNKEYSEKDKKESGLILNKLINKYNKPNNYYSNYYPKSDQENNMTWIEKLTNKFKINDINDSIFNITNKKYKLNAHYFSQIGLILFICSLFFATILFLYRHNHNKNFFWSLLGAVILFFFTIVLFIFGFKTLHFSYVIGILYLLAFLFFTIKNYFSKKIKILPVMGTNYFILIFPFIPVFFTSYYYTIMHNKFNNSTLYNSPIYDANKYDAIFKNESFHNQMAMWLGGLIFIIALHFIFGPLLKKTFSLPND